MLSCDALLSCTLMIENGFKVSSCYLSSLLFNTTGSNTQKLFHLNYSLYIECHFFAGFFFFFLGRVRTLWRSSAGENGLLAAARHSSIWTADGILTEIDASISSLYDSKVYFTSRLKNLSVIGAKLENAEI